MSAQRIPVAELLLSPMVDPEAHLDPVRVDHYAAMGDQLPPVVVFRTPEGLLLADGYHRLAAARRLGSETILAEIRPGSRADALRYAAEIGAAQRGMTPDQVQKHIQKRYDSKWS